MPRILTIVTGGVFPLAVAVWIAAVSIDAQAHGPGDWWPYPWLYGLAGAATVAAIVWIVLMSGSSSLRRNRSKPDFLLHRRGAQQWELERVGKATAYVVTQGDGLISASHIAGLMGSVIGDLARGEHALISAPNSEGCYVPFNWVESTGRYYSKSAFLEPGVDELKMFGVKVEPGKPIQT